MRLPPSSSPSPCRSTWSTGRGSGGRSRAGSWKGRDCQGRQQLTVSALLACNMLQTKLTSNSLPPE